MHINTYIDTASDDSRAAIAASGAAKALLYLFIDDKWLDQELHHSSMANLARYANGVSSSKIAFGN